MIFVDTNFFLRFLIKDEKRLYQEAKQFFLQAEENKVILSTNLIVIFEIYWVLKSFYRKKRRTVARILTDILKLDFIYFPERDLVKAALQLFVSTNLDLEDCYHLVYAFDVQAEDLATFDRQLKKWFLKLKNGPKN